MPLVIIDGPEAAGKTTIIDALLEEWGEPSMYRHWGPRDSWLEYCQPLFDDLKRCRENPTELIVWSRSWASRTIYNKLLNQGQSVPSCVTSELDKIVIRSGGFLGMVTAPVVTLLNRRLQRIAAGDPKQDHQLDVGKELAEFQKYGRFRGWNMLDGTQLVEDNVRHIIYLLSSRNPECRMVTAKEYLLAK